ncbi:hypothetical protein [Flavobacterium sp.]|nr:hypothetical protein [Flavobacterium sp.]
MKQLEDFECEKVDVKNIYGGGCPDTCTIIKGKPDSGKSDGPDCEQAIM